MSVSNALSAMTKSNQVRREGGKYRAIRDGDEPTVTPDAATGDEQLDGALGPS